MRSASCFPQSQFAAIGHEAGPNCRSTIAALADPSFPSGSICRRQRKMPRRFQPPVTGGAFLFFPDAAMRHAAIGGGWLRSGVFAAAIRRMTSL